MIDGFGLYGMALDYSLIFLFVGGAALIFGYLWSNGKLDLDEEPKNQMMRSEVIDE